MFSVRVSGEKDLLILFFVFFEMICPICFTHIAFKKTLLSNTVVNFVPILKKGTMLSTFWLK